MTSCKSDLGQYLKELRKARGKTLHQVSKETDIDSPLLSKIERGERFPTLNQLESISTYHNIVIQDLKTMLTAEKIIKDYGVSEITYNAIKLVEQQILPFLIEKK